LKRRLAGDLDSILAKALDKNVRDRYRSAEQLSADLGRHLDGRPILASSGGAHRAVGRFVSRHKFPIALGLGFLTAIYSGAIHIELAAWRTWAVRYCC
jgi:serine/threonine-protein kinase